MAYLQFLRGKDETETVDPHVSAAKIAGVYYSRTLRGFFWIV